MTEREGQCAIGSVSGLLGPKTETRQMGYRKKSTDFGNVSLTSIALPAWKIRVVVFFFLPVWKSFFSMENLNVILVKGLRF